MFFCKRKSPLTPLLVTRLNVSCNLSFLGFQDTFTFNAKDVTDEKIIFFCKEFLKTKTFPYKSDNEKYNFAMRLVKFDSGYYVLSTTGFKELEHFEKNNEISHSIKTEKKQFTLIHVFDVMRKLKVEA